MSTCCGTSIRSWLPAIGLVGLCMAVLWPSMGFDFLNWDDPSYVMWNPLIRGWSPANLWGICTEVVTRNFAPLTIFSYLLDHTLWGLNPGGYHLTNLLLHAANGVLVWLLVRRLTGSEFTAFVTAALFLIHPVQLESVVWISSRKGLLAGLFMLLALLVRTGRWPSGRQDLWYSVLLVAALLSKAQAVVLPPIVLLYDLLVKKDAPALAIPRQVIPGLLSLALLFLTMGAQNTVLGGVRSHMALSTAHIAAVDVVILWKYFAMLVYPQDLCVMYDPPTSGIALQVVAGAIGLALMAIPLWRARREQPLWVWGSATYLLLLFPMLNFVRITTLMNDRYLYLPCVVVFAMLAGGLQRVVQNGVAVVSGGNGRRAVFVTVPAAALVLAAAIMSTREYLPVWRDPDSLWTHAVRRCPTLAVVRIQMALTLHDSGRVPEAVVEMRRALQQCAPDELDRVRMRELLVQWETELAARPRVAAGADARTVAAD